MANKVNINEGRELLVPVVNTYAERIRIGEATHRDRLMAWVARNMGELLDEVQALRDGLDRWRNCFICIECGRGAVDEDGCCATCGRDCLCIVDGKLADTGIADHIDATTCDRHVGQVHGAEAEELRSGIERIMADPPGGDGESNAEWLHPLQALLDEVDARDSLAHLEGVDRLKRELAEAHEALTAQTAEVARLRGLAARGVRLASRIDEPRCDWACAECAPGSDLLIAGFRCDVHALRAAKESTNG